MEELRLVLPAARDAERIEEIAQMLSGSKISEAAIENAKQLLNQ